MMTSIGFIGEGCPLQYSLLSAQAQAKQPST
jgi:hypothetical protein